MSKVRLLLSPAQTQADCVVHIDQEWLDALNTDRKAQHMDKVTYETFEIVMDRLEKEWFDLVSIQTSSMAKHRVNAAYSRRTFPRRTWAYLRRSLVVPYAMIPRERTRMRSSFVTDVTWRYIRVRCCVLLFENY